MSPTKITAPGTVEGGDLVWLDDFRAANGRAPTDVDRQDRLFSLMCFGSGFESAWTEADWQRYRSYRDEFWRGVKQWFEGKLKRAEFHFDRDERLQKKQLW